MLCSVLFGYFSCPIDFLPFLFFFKTYLILSVFVDFFTKLFLRETELEVRYVRDEEDLKGAEEGEEYYQNIVSEKN